MNVLEDVPCFTDTGTDSLICDPPHESMGSLKTCLCHKVQPKYASVMQPMTSEGMALFSQPAGNPTFGKSGLYQKAATFRAIVGAANSWAFTIEKQTFT